MVSWGGKLFVSLKTLVMIRLKLPLAKKLCRKTRAEYHVLFILKHPATKQHWCHLYLVFHLSGTTHTTTYIYHTEFFRWPPRIYPVHHNIHPPIHSIKQCVQLFQITNNRMLFIVHGILRIRGLYCFCFCWLHRETSLAVSYCCCWSYVGITNKVIHLKQTI